MGDESHNRVAPPASDQEPPPAATAGSADDAEPERFEQEVVLVNRQGLHAFPAHVVAHVANCFKEVDVVLCQGDHCVDAKSVLMLLGLSSEKPLVKGTRLTVRASGINARTAAAVVAAVLNSGFGED